MIKILSHRGYWETDREKNSVEAFERSFSQGFGTETDVRDYLGELVISHDIANEACISARAFFEIYKNVNSKLPLALNLKADGLQSKLRDLILFYGIENYFVFDMSIPNTLSCISSKLICFTRQSEYEPSPALFEQVAGVWMDCFQRDWVEEHHIEYVLRAGKRVCLVSPDLHKRDNMLFWQKLSNMEVVNSDNLMICTDFPNDAREFFYGKN